MGFGHQRLGGGVVFCVVFSVVVGVSGVSVSGVSVLGIVEELAQIRGKAAAGRRLCEATDSLGSVETRSTECCE